MFRGTTQVASLVAHLEAREASLWHACQLTDLRSYLEVGGVPSRSLLEQARLPFTGFDTDSTDRAGGLWPKVFVNLSDFGAAFGHGAQAVPNPYGPIVFQLRPTALNRASDVAICLRSAGARGFDRDTESLDSLADIERLFRYTNNAPFPQSSFLLYGDELKSAFSPRYPEAMTAEVSLSMDPELLPLEDVIAIWVDPVAVGNGNLLSTVDDLVREAACAAHVHQRFMLEERRQVLDDLVEFVSVNGPPQLALLARRADAAEATREWAVTLMGRDLQWQFGRYSDHLAKGTIAELSVGARLRAAERPGGYSVDTARTVRRERQESDLT